MTKYVFNGLRVGDKVRDKINNKQRIIKSINEKEIVFEDGLKVETFKSNLFEFIESTKAFYVDLKDFEVEDYGLYYKGEKIEMGEIEVYEIINVYKDKIRLITKLKGRKKYALCEYSVLNDKFTIIYGNTDSYNSKQIEGFEDGFVIELTSNFEYKYCLADIMDLSDECGNEFIKKEEDLKKYDNVEKVIDEDVEGKEEPYNTKYKIKDTSTYYVLLLNKHQIKEIQHNSGKCVIDNVKLDKESFDKVNEYKHYHFLMSFSKSNYDYFNYGEFAFERGESLVINDFVVSMNQYDQIKSIHSNNILELNKEDYSNIDLIDYNYTPVYIINNEKLIIGKFKEIEDEKVIEIADEKVIELVKNKYSKFIFSKYDADRNRIIIFANEEYGVLKIKIEKTDDRGNIISYEEQ